MHGAYLVIHALPAVSDDTQQAQGLGQVLRRLRLSRAGWTRGSAAQLHRQSLPACQNVNTCMCGSVKTRVLCEGVCVCLSLSLCVCV